LHLLSDHFDFVHKKLTPLLRSHNRLLFDCEQSHIEANKRGVVHLRVALIADAVLFLVIDAQLHLVQGAVLACGGATARAVVLFGCKHSFEGQTAE